MKKRGHLVGLGVDGKILLNGRLWSGLIWRMTGTSGDLL